MVKDETGSVTTTFTFKSGNLSEKAKVYKSLMVLVLGIGD